MPPGIGSALPVKNRPLPSWFQRMFDGERSRSDPAAASGSRGPGVDLDGEPVLDIPVVPGGRVLFRVANTAGSELNFYVGSDEESEAALRWAVVPTPDGGAGMIDLIRDGTLADGDIVFLHTGGSAALFAYTDQLLT